jgi:hypothetical protein
VKTDRSRVRRAKLAETAKARMEPLKTRATFSPAANVEFQAGDPIELLEFVGATQPDSQSQAILYSAPIAFLHPHLLMLGPVGALLARFKPFRIF